MLSDTDVVTCDQAVFTSIRTPMGEGYRVIAASPRLRADEKQTITRYSPSHEGLCVSPNGPGDISGFPTGVAFYPLPSGRYCVAISCLAGQEHTGRGGQRVYTHCVVFDQGDLGKYAYNAFNIVRAMVAEGLGTPQLKPPNPLPELRVDASSTVDETGGASLHSSVHRACRCAVLTALLERRKTILDIEGGWIETAEAILLGIPALERADVSFAAGLRFSLGRQVTLHLLHDPSGQARARSKGQSIQFVAPSRIAQEVAHCSEWVKFVDRQWDRDDIASLARRTAISFTRVDPDARERIGKLYNLLDDIPEMPTSNLLCVLGEHFSPSCAGVENEITADVLKTGLACLSTRLAGSWADATEHWSTLVETAGKSLESAAFLQPLIERTLRSAMRSHPLDVAAAALDLATAVGPLRANASYEKLFRDILDRVAAWGQTASETDHDRLRALCEQWKRVRPKCPIVHRISLIPVASASPR